MYERILIPLDGSQEAEAAVHEVVHLSANPTIVHLQLVENGVMQSRQLEGYTLYADQIHDARARAGEAYVQPLRRMLEDRGLRVEVSITNGAPLHEVAKRAEKLDADLILIGAGEEGWLGRRFGLARLAPRLVKRVNAHVLLVQRQERVQQKEALSRAA
jgi:nucleotide-binding universal stress UspA family protein